MIEQTLILVKPEHVPFAFQLLYELDKIGTRVKDGYIAHVPRELIEKHYAVHLGQSHYPRLLKQFTGLPVVGAIYEGENIIQEFMDEIGNTFPNLAAPRTVRHRFSNDSREIATLEDKAVRNVLHRSDDPQNAISEIRLWSPYLNGLDEFYELVKMRMFFSGRGEYDVKRIITER
ncbi:MAG: nucleoside-diphosphate kinase [archaeon]